MISDALAMGLALEASKNGFPAPNPHVGCVLVKGGEVIATGFHDHAGGPHAEIDALAKVGGDAQGATAYVTLEPCNGTGRTPPCSLALIKAGVARVVYGASDPNPKMAGGAQVLREAGIECQKFEVEDQANVPWLTAMKRQSPFVALKAAASLDGRIALPSGESKWITGEAARVAGRALRAQYGAVLIGRRTAELDNPLLTARTAGVVNQPTRIVLDLEAKLPTSLQVFNKEAPTLHVVRDPSREGQVPAQLIDGRLDLPQLMADLFGMGITSLLVEGGATTLAAFVRAGLGDRLHLFVAPKFLGTGPSWMDDFGLTSLTKAPTWRRTEVKEHGQDLEIVLEPYQSCE